MKWINLRKNRCPQCNKDLLTGLKVEGTLWTHKCGFKITEQRFKEITTSMNDQEIEKLLTL